MSKYVLKNININKGFSCQCGQIVKHKNWWFKTRAGDYSYNIFFVFLGK